MDQPTIEPDTKDWTWVLGEVCPECGFDAETVDRSRLGDLVRDNAKGWSAVLGQPGATTRPDPQTWSPTEYACHVRDVHRVFGRRLALMLEHDEPTFDNWDQDETAVAERYDRQDPAAVGPELVAAADEVATRYDALADEPDATWSRCGLRSNGSEFTVDSIARYHLHDVVHHAHDVRTSVSRATVSAYDGDALGYSDGSWELNAEVVVQLDGFVAAVAPGGSVLEIGSAGGRDAIELEARGLTVRRTDVSAGFVDLMRERGYAADVLDPLTDDLVDERHGPYDGVWASACLLHVARPDLPVVLARLAAATKPGGVLGMSVKQGDGEGWSTHGQVRRARHFVYWREEPLRTALADAGWDVVNLDRTKGESPEPWLAVRAVRAVRATPAR